MPIATVSPASAAALILEAALEGRPLQVHLCNAFTLSLVDADARLRGALLEADLNLPDGTPVAWLLRRHGCAGPVRGPGLLPDVARLGAEAGVRHYLWGGGPGIADEVAARLRERTPGVHIVGCESPPYREPSDDDLEGLAQRARTARAQIVWVALGTPRQDYVVPRLTPVVSCPVVPIGAAFDFIAGRVPEAAEILHGSGLEWLHRLRQDPRRLWRRYLLGNPRFVVNAMRHAREDRT